MSKLEELEKQLSDLFADSNRIREEINAVSDQIKQLKSSALDLSIITPQVFLSVKNYDQYNESVYRTLSNWFDQNYISKGLYRSGYWTNTEETALNLKMDQNQPFEDQLGLLDFIPYMESDMVGIMDTSLSQYGVHRLEKLKTEPVLTITTYGRTTVKNTFSTLMEALRYVYDKLPCSYREGEDEYKSEFEDD